MLKIETNALLDSYLIHIGINKRFRAKSSYVSPCSNKRRIFKNGLTLDEGSVVFKYLKKGVDYKHYKKMGVNYGLSDYEMHTNNIVVYNPISLDIIKSEDAYYATLMGKLLLSNLKFFKRVLKKIAQTNFIKQSDTFCMFYHIENKEDFLEDFYYPKDVTSCFQLFKPREYVEYHKLNFWPNNAPIMLLIFNKSTYSELKSTWIEDHLKEKYGSLEEAKRICQEKHPDIFAFAEKLKDRK